MIRNLKIDDEGNLVALYHPDGAPEDTIPMEVPDGYPTEFKWNKNSRSFYEDLTSLEELLCSKVDQECLEFKKKFVTVGMDSVYKDKQEEAKRCLSGDKKNLPFLEAEARIKNKDIDSIAAKVNKKAENWTILNAKIEALRVVSKQNILKQDTKEKKIQASHIDWEAILEK